MLRLQVWCSRVTNSHVHSQTRLPNDLFSSCGWLLGLFYARTCSLQLCDARARRLRFDLGIFADTAPADGMPLSSSSVFILGSAWLYLMLASIGYSRSLKPLAAAGTAAQRRRSSPGRRCPLQECWGWVWCNGAGARP